MNTYGEQQPIRSKTDLAAAITQITGQRLRAEELLAASPAQLAGRLAEAKALQARTPGMIGVCACGEAVCCGEGAEIVRGRRHLLVHDTCMLPGDQIA